MNCIKVKRICRFIFKRLFGYPLFSDEHVDM